MVKLNTNYLIKKIIKSTCVSDKDRKEAFKKINHLCLSNKSIHQIEDLSLLTNLTDLYLHENKIPEIENLDHNLNLTHLYLQYNNIKKITNLSHLRKLKKLYLGHNNISLVESFDNIENLEELHIESQRLPPGESLYFDPRAIQAISKSLRILDVSGNHLVTLEDLKELQAIEELDASDNKLANLFETCKIISNWYNLTSLILKLNPFEHHKKYVERITIATHILNNLDGKDVKDETRQFLRNIEIAKMEKKKAEDKGSSHYRFSDDIEGLADHLPPGIRNSISHSILKETVPSINNLTLSLQQPDIKELPLEKRTLVRSIKKNYNIKKNTRNDIQDEKELQLSL